MQAYIIRRLLMGIPTLIGITLLVFLSLHFMPIDPARMLLIEHGAGTAPTITGEITETQIEEQRKRMGLDQPLHIQFINYMGDLLRGNLGMSWRERVPVSRLIIRHAPHTIQLSLFALMVTATMGVFLGVMAAVREHSWFDTMAMSASVVGVSTPNFWLGLLLIMFVAYGLGWFPAFGARGWQYLVLPGIALGTGGAATVARLTRANLVEVLRSDYVRTARAKGLSERVIQYKHALRNAMIPVSTILGLQVGRLLGGSVIIENVFGRPGWGRIAVNAIREHDYPVVQAGVLMIALSFVLVNLLVDVGYAFLDPRIRYN